MVSGGGRARPQEDSLNNAVDMVVGTPGRVLQHIEEGNIVYGDIKYLVSVLMYRCHIVLYLYGFPSASCFQCVRNVGFQSLFRSVRKLPSVSLQ